MYPRVRGDDDFVIPDARQRDPESNFEEPARSGLFLYRAPFRFAGDTPRASA